MSDMITFTDKNDQFVAFDKSSILAIEGFGCFGEMDIITKSGKAMRWCVDRSEFSSIKDQLGLNKLDEEQTPSIEDIKQWSKK